MPSNKRTILFPLWLSHGRWYRYATLGIGSGHRLSSPTPQGARRTARSRSTRWMVVSPESEMIQDLNLFSSLLCRGEFMAITERLATRGGSWTRSRLSSTRNPRDSLPDCIYFFPSGGWPPLLYSRLYVTWDHCQCDHPCLWHLALATYGIEISMPISIFGAISVTRSWRSLPSMRPKSWTCRRYSYHLPRMRKGKTLYEKVAQLKFLLGDSKVE